MPTSRGRSECVAPSVGLQAQTATRAQLRDAGLSDSFIDAQLDARRWQAWGPLVIVMHNGPLTRVQLLWAATLHVGPRGCLAARTALEPHGFRGFDDELVHVVHPRATSVVPMPGCRSREPTDRSHRHHPASRPAHGGGCTGSCRSGGLAAESTVRLCGPGSGGPAADLHGPATFSGASHRWQGETRPSHAPGHSGHHPGVADPR